MSGQLHPDFPHGLGEGWFANANMQKAQGIVFSPDSLMMRVFITMDELWLLASCPFMAKLGHSEQPALKPYCLFLYPHPQRDTIEDMKNWAQERAFSNVAVFSQGSEIAG